MCLDKHSLIYEIYLRSQRSLFLKLAKEILLLLTIIRYLGAKAGYKLYGGQNLYEQPLIDQWLNLIQSDFDACAIAINLYLEGK